jgi:hypothetical protein
MQYIVQYIYAYVCIVSAHAVHTLLLEGLASINRSIAWTMYQSCKSAILIEQNTSHSMYVFVCASSITKQIKCSTGRLHHTQTIRSFYFFALIFNQLKDKQLVIKHTIS